MGDSPFFFSERYIVGCTVVEGVRETPWYMKQITAALPSSMVSICRECTGNPAEVKWMQAYTQTNSHLMAHVYTYTLSLPFTNQSASSPLHTHAIENVLAVLHLYILYYIAIHQSTNISECCKGFPLALIISYL